MIVLDVLGYFNRNKQNSYAALSTKKQEAFNPMLGLKLGKRPKQ